MQQEVADYFSYLLYRGKKKRPLKGYVAEHGLFLIFQQVKICHFINLTLTHINICTSADVFFYNFNGQFDTSHQYWGKKCPLN